MQYRHDNETIDVRPQLPVLPLRDVVVFPYMIYPLLIGRPMSISALQEAMVQDKLVFLVAQRNPTVDNPKQDDLYHIGVVARVVQVMKMPNGTLKVLVEGLLRAKIKSLDQQIGYMVARIKVIEEERESTDPETEALARRVMDLFSDYVYLNRRIPNEIVGQLAAINDNRRLADTVAANLLQKNEQKQTVLETSTVKNQLFSLIDLLSAEIEILKIEQRIDGSVRESLSRSQREYYLQQQLKAIKEELGQYDETAGDIDELHTRLEELAPPEPVRLRVEEELKKLGKMHPYSAESAVVRGYIEWVLALPWGKKTQDRTDFNAVQKILDDDHYGLEKPKKRIIEHLAVLKMAGKVRGPILCLVGPPGVGKTSLGKSVARALDRKFVRMSLGGVHDEAEIRGHRRTYIGSLPGRIIQSIKRAGSANPVFLLDEVDKIGADFRGDPAAALLEVLDPEQNCTFSDNYLELDFDLSEVLFLTTANILHDIPIPLQDRMEIIRLPGYLEFEKAHIARKFLIPKIRKELGIEKIKIELSDQALTHLIRDYTRESGVRELERKLTAVFRKIAVKEVTRKKYRSYLLKPNNIAKLIGPPAYLYAEVPETAEPGYAVGLAWTETGGEILPVEVSLVPGQHKLTITGKIGEVMQESATAGLTWIRAHAAQMDLDLKKIANTEIHIHIPEGAVPKEGPSAGVTMVSAMVSALTGRPVSTKIAMTGEISLTGDMLPVGGLNEKLLAAKRSGLKEIIVPFKNNKDITELPAELLKGLNIRPVKNVEEALGIIFGAGFFRPSLRKPRMVALKKKRAARKRP
jgi:ATP-dependent Lon protease